MEVLLADYEFHGRGYSLCKVDVELLRRKKPGVLTILFSRDFTPSRLKPALLSHRMKQEVACTIHRARASKDQVSWPFV